MYLKRNQSDVFHGMKTIENFGSAAKKIGGFAHSMKFAILLWSLSGNWKEEASSGSSVLCVGVGASGICSDQRRGLAPRCTFKSCSWLRGSESWYVCLHREDDADVRWACLCVDMKGCGRQWTLRKTRTCGCVGQRGRGGGKSDPSIPRD